MAYRTIVFMWTLGMIWGMSIQSTWAKEYQVVVVRARILPTQQDRSCWDGCAPWQAKPLQAAAQTLRSKKGERAWQNTYKTLRKHSGLRMPDPWVHIRFSNGQSLRTPVKKDTLVPEWGATTRVDLRKHDALEVTVWDQDLQHHDRIGYFPLHRISDRIVQKGGEWTIRFQRVYALTLLFVPVQSPTRGLFVPGLYELTIIRAKILPLSEEKKSWDIWKGRPDPFVHIQIGTRSIQTPTERNTLSPHWRFSKRVYINGHEPLSFTIWDRDIRQNDRIGKCHYPLIAQIPLDKKGVFRSRCQRASLLVLQLKKIR